MKFPSLHMSLSAPGFRVLRLGQWILVLVTVGAPLLAGWFWLESRDREHTALRYEQATGRVLERIHEFKAQAALAGITLTEERIQGLDREISFANQVLAKREFSWTRLLTDLEDAVSKGVSLNSVRLNFKDSMITLQGAARTLQDLTALVNGLENHPAFRNVLLSQHSIQKKNQTGGKAGPEGEEIRFVTFSMTVDYRPSF